MLRASTPADAAVCGPICFEGSRQRRAHFLDAVADNGLEDAAVGFYRCGGLERNVGSNFLDERPDRRRRADHVDRRAEPAAADKCGARPRHGPGGRLSLNRRCVSTPLGFETAR